MDTRPDTTVSAVKPARESNTALPGTLTLRKTGVCAAYQVNEAMSESQRIVIVTHSYAPLLNPRAFRWTAIAERWAQEGRQVDVICAWGADLPDSELRNLVRIHRVGAGIVERLRSLLRATERSSRSNSVSAETTVAAPGANSVTGVCNRALKTFVHTGHDLTWKKVYWPDYATLWAKPAIRKVNEVLNDIENQAGAGVDVTLITVSDPFTAHIVGRALKRKRPELNWVVDIGDPFCFRHDTPTNNHALYRRLNYNYERKVFCEADKISVTTGATKRKYVELFPGAADKITVIPPLVSLTAGEKKASPLGDSASLKALFTGALYRQIRNPEPLLRLFADLRQADPQLQVELHFFGPFEDCKDVFDKYEARLAESVRLYGLMSRDMTTAALDQADLLINIGNASPYQLPSKVVEYASTAKPILNIACFADDSSAAFFADRPNTLTINVADKRSQAERISELREFICRHKAPVSQSYRERIIEEHSATTIAARYSALFVKETEKAVTSRMRRNFSIAPERAKTHR